MNGLQDCLGYGCCGQLWPADVHLASVANCEMTLVLRRKKNGQCFKVNGKPAAPMRRLCSDIDHDPQRDRTDQKFVGDRMLTMMLKLAAMPVILLAAAPAFAAVNLSATGLSIAREDSDLLARDVPVSPWYAERDRSDQLVLEMVDLDSPVLGQGPVARPNISIMPEPASWGMMIAGLAAVGCAVRGLPMRGRGRISFV